MECTSVQKRGPVNCCIVLAHLGYQAVNDLSMIRSCSSTVRSIPRQLNVMAKNKFESDDSILMQRRLRADSCSSARTGTCTVLLRNLTDRRHR